MNFALAIIAEVNTVAKEMDKSNFIIGYRLSPEELSNPGITLDDTMALVDKLSDQPIDYLHTSMGDYRRTSLRDRNDKTEINKRVLAAVDNRKPLIEVGSIATPAQAEDALDRGATLAAMG